MFDFGFKKRNQDQLLQEPKLFNRRTSDQWYGEDQDQQLWNEEFPKFQFLKQLASTDCSVIWLVKDLQSDVQKVAKIIPRIENSQTGKKHQAAQLQFLQKIKLKNAVQIYEIQYSEEFYLISMEYLKQGDLAQYLSFYSQNMMLNFSIQHLKWVTFCFKQIVDSVSELHQKGYIHRDLKPSNFLIDQNGHLKLNDFGLITQYNSTDMSYCGTLQYIAPEILQNKKIKFPASTSLDIWSLGIILYELLMGKAPYQGQSRQELFQLIYSGYIQFKPQLPESFKQLIKNLLQINPSKRMDMQTLKNHSLLKL